MKKVLLSAIVLFCVATAASAQEAGQKWLGGSIGFTNTKVKGHDHTEGYKETNYSIRPEFGYAFSDHWAIGIRAGYSHGENQADGDANTRRTNGYSVTPFVRYSFLRGKVGNLFLEGGVGYEHSQTKYRGMKSKMNAYEVGITPGVSVNLSEKLALIGTFGFLGYEHTKVGEIKTDRIAANFQFDRVTLGVNYRF